ncbi:MAG: glycosyltransferase family 29 protein [Vibrio sp.]
MKQLDPFDFIANSAEGQSVIFVGNAPSLTAENQGDWIDSHDIVVRFNQLPYKDMKSDVGIKTTYLVTNPYVEARSDILAYDPNMTVIVLFSQTRRGNKKSFYHWLNGNNVLFSYAPDIMAVKNNRHFESLTTGTYGTQFLSRVLKPSKISVTGFTMFLGDTNHHYWSSIIPTGTKAHDFEIEAKVFINIINAFREKAKITVTEDILWVSKKSKVKLKKNIIVKKLNNIRWRNESRCFWNFRCR